MIAETQGQEKTIRYIRKCHNPNGTHSACTALILHPKTPEKFCLRVVTSTSPELLIITTFFKNGIVSAEFAEHLSITMLGFGQIQQELSRGPAIAAISVAVADF